MAWRDRFTFVGVAGDDVSYVTMDPSSNKLQSVSEMP